MPIDFYYADYSPPCRVVLMVAKALNIELNLKVVDTRAKEHLEPEFIKINPQHCIPTLVDDGFAIWESRAIITYLATKYGKGKLYPDDPRQKAVVNQRLFFDMGSLYHRFADYMYPQIFANQPADAEKFKKLVEAIEFLNTFLEGNQWVAGSSMTVADYTILNTISLFGVLDVDVFKYPNIKAWYERARTSLPGFSLCEEGAELFRKLIQDLKANAASGTKYWPALRSHEASMRRADKSKYSKGSNLYPEDPRQRAVVDQRLYFDIDTLYHRFSDYYVEPLFYGNKPSDETLKKLVEALELLNKFLENNQWVAGSTMTLADFAIINTVSYFGVLNVDIFKYPNIQSWYERAKSSLPDFSVVEEGIEIFEKLLKDFTGSA